MIRLYSHFVEFVNPKTMKFVLRDEGRFPWVTDKNLAIRNMEKDIQWCEENDSSSLKENKWGIIERDFDSIITLEGELNKRGSYETFEICVGEDSLYNSLYSNYRGNKVRITMEILPD